MPELPAVIAVIAVIAVSPHPRVEIEVRDRVLGSVAPLCQTLRGPGLVDRRADITNQRNVIESRRLNRLEVAGGFHRWPPGTSDRPRELQ